MIWALLALLMVAAAAGCAGNAPQEPDTRRQTRESFPVPQADGTVLLEGEDASVDISHAEDGYVMVRYTGTAAKAKIQITAPDTSIYRYTLLGNAYETIPLSGGNGVYHVDVLENVYDDMYALLLSRDIQVELADPFSPFLYPNQYVWIVPDSPAARLAKTLSEESKNDLDYVGKVYHYVISHILYDTEKARNVSVDYIPDIDRILEEGKGICFDYASLMAGMLRAQGIPTKLEVGYAGQVYHAWISVYIEEVGWIDRVIQFDGRQWSLMDPTLAANNDSRAVKEYIGDGSNYTVKYSY